MSARPRIVLLFFRRDLCHVGYGDLVLPKEWRLYGPVEGFTGTLMCGLSIAFFFAMVSKKFFNASTMMTKDDFVNNCDLNRRVRRIGRHRKERDGWNQSRPC